MTSGGIAPKLPRKRRSGEDGLYTCVKILESRQTLETGSSSTTGLPLRSRSSSGVLRAASVHVAPTIAIADVAVADVAASVHVAPTIAVVVQ